MFLLLPEGDPPFNDSSEMTDNTNTPTAAEVVTEADIIDSPFVLFSDSNSHEVMDHGGIILSYMVI